MTLPKRVEHRQPRVRRDLASALRSAAAGPRRAVGRQAQRRRAEEPDVDPELAALREQIAQPSRPSRFRTAKRWCGLAERYLRIERDNAQIQQKVAAATNSLARTFDRIVVLLTERGFIEERDGDPDGHRRRPAARADLQRERPVGRRMSAAAARGTAWRPPSWRPWCRRCSTSRAATRPVRHRVSTSPTARLRRALAQTRRLWTEICAPTSSATGSRQSREPDDGFRRRHPPLGDHRRSDGGAGRLRRRGQRNPVVRR